MSFCWIYCAGYSPAVTYTFPRLWMETESECELCASVLYPRITEASRRAVRAQGGGWRAQTCSISWKALQFFFRSQGAEENCGRSKPHSRLRSDACGPSASSVRLWGLKGLLLASHHHCFPQLRKKEWGKRLYSSRQQLIFVVKQTLTRSVLLRWVTTIECSRNFFNTLTLYDVTIHQFHSAEQYHFNILAFGFQQGNEYDGIIIVT